MLSALAFAVIGAPVMPPFDASLKAHSHLKSVSVQIDSTTKTMQLNRAIKGTFQIQNGSRAKLSVLRNGKPYRWYLYDGTLLSGYDTANDEYLNLRVTGKQPFIERFFSVVPDADTSLRTVLSTEAMSKLYNRLKTVKGWHVKNKSTYYFSGPVSQFVVEFDPNTHYLKRFELTGNGNRMRWKYKWGASGSISKQTVPITAVKASAFTDPKPPAVFASEKARLIARASVKAYGVLANADMEIKGAEPTSVVMRRGKAQVKSPSYEWRYDGKNVLIMFTKSKKAFFGPTTLLGLSEALAKANCDTDAYALQVVARKNPMRRLLYGGMKVKVIGSVSLEGQPCELLEVASGEIRITVAVRNKDNLIASETSTYITRGSGAEGGSDRQISYGLKQTSASTFSTQPPRGYKVVKLK